VAEVRFHLDEHIDNAIAQALVDRGIDVTTTVQAGLRGSDDSAHLAFCRREGRVIVTDDYDFLRIASARADHAGIAFCHKGRLTIGQIIGGLTLIHQVLEAGEMAGHVEFL
jgi:predicted nuclease of predicted toxin-antitoxin system